MPPAARIFRAICTYATEKIVRTIVAKKKAAGAYFSFPAPTTNGKLNMNTASGAEPVTQRKSTRRRPIEPDRSFSTCSRIGDVDRGDRPLVDHMRVNCTPRTFRAGH